MTHRCPVFLKATGLAPDAPAYLEVTTLSIAAEAPAGGGKREVTGLALPYLEDLDRPDWLTGASKQRFALESGVVRDNATFYYGHDHLSDGLPIGRIASNEHTDKGLKLSARFANTLKANEVYELTKPDDEGKAVLDRFSVGFYSVKSHLEDNDTVLVHDEVDIFEVSVVPDPAFKSAVIESVLSNPKETNMPCSKCGKVHAAGVTDCQLDPSTLASAADVTTLSTAVEELTRKVATLGSGGREQDGPTVPFKSYGEFLQNLARGDKDALDFLAFVGGTTDDLGPLMKDSWVGDRYKFIEAQRTTINFFTRRPLPSTGMQIEYGVEGTDTTQVAEQVNEGDLLVYGKIDFDTDSKRLKTYGGWGDMSRQEIERSPINVVERFFTALLRRYAQTTEAKVNAMVKASGIALGGGVLDLATVDGWTMFVIRAARIMKDRGYPIEGLMVGFDVFEDLALMRDGAQADAPRFLDRSTGSISVTGLNGQVFNLPIIPIETGATTNVVRAANSEAISVYEASGTPFRMQDDDITNLTKAFSVYGYMLDALEVPGALVKPQGGN